MAKIENAGFTTALHDDFWQYFDDYYAGKIPAGCTCCCPDDCAEDHGYFDPNLEYVELFKERE